MCFIFHTFLFRGQTWPCLCVSVYVWGVVCVCVYEVYSIPISKCVRVYTHVEMEADGRYFPCNFSETGTDPGAHQFD